VVGAPICRAARPRTVRNNVKADARGFDVRTGRRKWIFHTNPAQGRTFAMTAGSFPGQAEATGNTGVGPDLGRRRSGSGLLPVELPTATTRPVSRRQRAVPVKALSRSMSRPANANGTTRRCIMGLGTWTFPALDPGWSCPLTGKTVKVIRPADQECFSTMCVNPRKPASRIWPIPEIRCPRAMCRANGIRPPSLYRPSRRAMTCRALPSTTDRLHARVARPSGGIWSKNYTIARWSRRRPWRWRAATAARCMRPLQWRHGLGGPVAAIPKPAWSYIFFQTALARSGVIKNEDKDVSDFDYVQASRPAYPSTSRWRAEPRRAVATRARGADKRFGGSRPALIPVQTSPCASGPRRLPAAVMAGKAADPGEPCRASAVLKPPYGASSRST